MRARPLQSALAFFGIASVLGAAFAVFGAISLIRALGLAALTFAALGCAVQLYALHEFAPEAYAALRERFVGYRRRVSEKVGALSFSFPRRRPA